MFFDKFNETDHLKVLVKDKNYKIDKVDGNSKFSGISGDRATAEEFEVWQVIFTEEFQNEYSMQWLEEDHASEIEIARRKKRDEVEEQFSRRE